MIVARRIGALAAVGLCAVSLHGFAFAQTKQVPPQPSSIREGAAVQTGSASSWRSDYASGSSAVKASGDGSGTSRWSPGRGSFAAGSAHPAGTTGVAGSGISGGSSSWIAGRGVFSSKAQPGGIWRDNGVSLASPGSGLATSSASGQIDSGELANSTGASANRDARRGAVRRALPRKRRTGFGAASARSKGLDVGASTGTNSRSHGEGTPGRAGARLHGAKEGAGTSSTDFGSPELSPLHFAPPSGAADQDKFSEKNATQASPE